QMLEEVTREYDVERMIIHVPTQAAILTQEADVGVQIIGGRRREIHGELLNASDVVYDLSIAAAAVQYSRRRFYIGRKNGRRKHFPSSISGGLFVSEPPLIDRGKFLGRIDGGFHGCAR